MKILVTGGAGFIGSHLIEALIGYGHEVSTIDALVPELYPKQRKLLNWENLGQLNRPPERILFDLRNYVDPVLVADYDYIYHLAAMPGLSLSWEDSKLYIDSNLLATSNLLKACNPLTLKKFIFVSTSSVYGKTINGDETSGVKPVSPYGVTKLAAEKLVEAYSISTGLSYSIIRPFSVYGPRQRDDMAFHIFIEKMLQGKEISVFGDGRQSRTNTYVSDLVLGLTSAMVKSKNGHIYNLAGNQQVSVNEILQTLELLLGVKARVKFMPGRLGDQQETYTASTKAREHLGFSPKESLQSGLLKQITWQKNLSRA
jgi:UDP-glucuronate 4-epimerase